MHVQLPQPSFSVRVWNGTPTEFLLKCAELTRTGVGVAATIMTRAIIPAFDEPRTVIGGSTLL